HARGAQIVEERLVLVRSARGLRAFDELVQRLVTYAHAGPALEGEVPDGVQEVRLAETGSRADEERVVARARTLAHTASRRGGQPVRGIDNERVERQPRIQREGRLLHGDVNLGGLLRSP